MIHIDKAIVVEGKYDRMRLSGVTDAPVIETGGFNLYKNGEVRDLIKRMARDTGIIVLTDSDPAGLKLRAYIGSLVREGTVIHAYVPEICGTERRKTHPGAAGILGVEGIEDDVIENILRAVTQESGTEGRDRVSFAEWYEAGLSGQENSRQKRRDFLMAHGLPGDLSQKQALKYLNAVYPAEELRKDMGLQ